MEKGKPVVARMMTVNFIVDHRYLDGAKAKSLIPNFLKVFENPEKYSSSSVAKVEGEGVVGGSS